MDPSTLTYNTFDTQMHAMEALADLYQASKDPLVGVRLAEIVDLSTTKLVDQQKGYVPRVFTQQWTPVSSIYNNVLAGLNLELTALLINSAAAIGRGNETAVQQAALRASHLATAALDGKQGGFFYVLDLNGTVIDASKVWWVQSEALLGLWRLHKLDPEDASLLPAMRKTLDWLETKQLDQQYGEFFWGIDPSGQLTAQGSNKGNFYKATYHSLGHLLTLTGMLEADG